VRVLAQKRINSSGEASSHQQPHPPAFGHARSSTLDSRPIPSIHLPLQRKLAIGAVNDPLELQADAMADRVMKASALSSSTPILQRKCSCGGSDEECDSCKANRGSALQRKSATPEATSVAPPIVHDVLHSSGQPLDSATRSLMSPRFGADVSNVRVHTGARAAESASALNALAYTVGRDVVFGANQYQPGTREGQRLLAHELAHVIQQHEAPFFTVQRACRSAAQCAVPSSGSAGTFGATVEAESEALARASGGVPPVGGGPTPCLFPRHGDRATNFETLATTAGLGAAIAPGIAGFFINACLSPNDGATNDTCGNFPGGPPGGAPAAKFCVQLHTTDEDTAIALLAKPKPLSYADQRMFLWITSSVVHESQHNRFDATASTVVPAAVECNLSTSIPIAAGRTVGNALSEISAQIGEFDVYYRNKKLHPGLASGYALQTEEHNISSRGGETILGNIKDIQCVCNCNTVNTFVEKVFNDAANSWTAPDKDAEKNEFNKALTAFIPSFWPPSLHRT
jgi:hypothetical protein